MESFQTQYTAFRAWMDEDARASSIIVASMEVSLSSDIVCLESAQLMWAHLHERYAPIGDSLFLSVVHREHSLQQGDATIDEFYDQMSAIWHQLNSLEPALCPTCVICQNIKSHHQFHRIYDFLTRLRVEFEKIRAQLLAHHPPIRTSSSTSTGPDSSAVTTIETPYGGERPHCTYCNKAGHSAYYCNKEKRDTDARRGGRLQRVREVVPQHPPLLLDLSVSPLIAPLSVQTADGTSLFVVGRGTLSSSSFSVSSISFVPQLAIQLISAGQLTDHGCRIILDSDSCSIQDRRTGNLDVLTHMHIRPNFNRIGTSDQVETCLLNTTNEFGLLSLIKRPSQSALSPSSEAQNRECHVAAFFLPIPYRAHLPPFASAPSASMSSLSFFASNAIGTLDSRISAASTPLPSPMKLKLNSLLNASFDFPRFKLRNFAFRKRLNRVSCNLHTFPVNTRNYEFLDGSSEVELRVKLESAEAIGPKDIVLDAGETTLTIKVRRYGLLTTVVEIGRLFDRIRPSETIWYIDENELVVSLKKQDIELKWPDILESWVSLTTVAAQLLKGTSIYLVGESTEINQIVARELSAGLGYAPIATKELLETISNQTIDSWMAAEGSESVAEAESSVFESLSTQVRAVVGTLGGRPGAAGRPAKWRHLYAGFTVWLSKSEAAEVLMPLVYATTMQMKHPQMKRQREIFRTVA
ncbi:hypothetical protein QQ045_019756 [Rhodiola kirilowii]